MTELKCPNLAIKDRCYQITIDVYINIDNQLKLNEYKSGFEDEKGNSYKPVLAWEKQSPSLDFVDLTSKQTQNLFEEIYIEADIERFVAEEVD